MKHFLLLGLLSTFFVFAACDKEDEFITDADAKLEFSLDTLRFDTVFTELGSATRLFKVYNRNSKSILISNISIEGGENTAFRLNIDGIPGNEATDIRILPNDSLYIFGEVTVDPDQPLSASPFVIEDNIVFETNGNTQLIHLEAWGQNANYFPSRFNAGVPVVLGCDNGEIVWDDPKPYVIYGEVFIDSCTLVIPEGTHIYVHGGIAQNDLFGGVFNDGILYVLQNGRLDIRGTKENPVVIQGDRLEESFQDDPGQWNGIIIGRGSKGNKMEYTTVKNSRFAVLVDSTGELTASNSQFYNTSSSSLIGFASTINLDNCLIYNSGSTSLLLTLGGNYNFNYCTIASYGVDASALSMENIFCYDDRLSCQVNAILPLKVRFKNSIIFGSRQDEIQLFDATGGNEPTFFDVKFEDCIVKVNELLESQDGLFGNFFNEECTPCINGTRDDAIFVDPGEDDYHLDTLSIAEGMAKPITFPTLISIDLEGNDRDTENPDIGCFEYQYQ